MVQAVKLPVDSSADATQLAGTMFGSGVQLVSASYSGDPLSKGIYSDGLSVSPGAVPSDRGIILSTGRASDFTNATGSGDANQNENLGSDTNGVDGNAVLDAAAGGATFDGAILQAQFIPTGQFLTMQLVFASDEYPEYADSGFSDVVRIMVNGQTVQLSIGSGEISIDNITPGGQNVFGNEITPRNENLYVDNTGSQFNSEMDGLTVTLTMKAPVIPGQVNSIFIGIADMGDPSYDSALLIVADSVQTAVIANPDEARVQEGETVVLDVLGNDSSLQGASLAITQINGQPVAPGDSVTLVSGAVVTVNADGTLNFNAAALGTETITYQVGDGAGTTDTGFVTVQVTCFARGTRIDTPQGPRAIEELAVGDPVRTRDHGAQPIRWLGTTRITAARLAAMPQLRPIRIRAGALGANLPDRDLLVSPQHRILVRSKIAQSMFSTTEVLVAAKQLVLLDGIDVAHDLEEVEYFHLLFERHEIVTSNGAETESLFTGPEAIRAVGEAAQREIFALFPQLCETGFVPQAARPLVTGRLGRKLATRQARHRRALVS